MHSSSYFIHRTIFISVFISSTLSISSVVHANAADTLKLKNLSTFLSSIEKKHPKLQMGQAELDASKARTRAAAQSFYNPELELDVERTGFNRNNVDTVVVGINQTIDWYNKRTARKNTAIISQQVTQLEQKLIQQDLTADIFSRLVDYQMQREIITAHSNRLSLFNQVLTQARRLYKAGDISKLDFEQIRLSQTRAQLILNQEKTQLVSHAKSLASTTGVFRKSWPVLPETPPTINIKGINFNQIANSSSLIKLKKAKIVEARSIMRLKVRQQKPDPTVGFRAGGEDSERIVGFTLSIPLNVRNNYQAEVDESRAYIKRAENELENAKHQLKSSFLSAAQTYELIFKSWQSWRRIAGDSLKNQSKLLIRLWKAGELSTSDYLVQLNQIKEAELNNVELKGDVWKAWFNWLANSYQTKKWLSGSSMSSSHK